MFKHYALVIKHSSSHLACIVDLIWIIKSFQNQFILGFPLCNNATMVNLHNSQQNNRCILELKEVKLWARRPSFRNEPFMIFKWRKLAELDTNSRFHFLCQSHQFSCVMPTKTLLIDLTWGSLQITTVKPRSQEESLFLKFNIKRPPVIYSSPSQYWPFDGDHSVPDYITWNQITSFCSHCSQVEEAKNWPLVVGFDVQVSSNSSIFSMVFWILLNVDCCK